MKAVLMAGGEGSRLRPLTVTRPKPMIPLVNKSIMAHVLDMLKTHGITEVIVTVRYMAASIQDFFEDGRALGMKLTYAVEEFPLGTAGSVRNAADLLDDTFLVISGDALTDFDLGALIRRHRQSDALATIALTHVHNPLDYGVIVGDENGRITQFLEKPSWGEVISDTVNTGIYVLEPEVLEHIPPQQAYDFATELFPSLLEEGAKLYGHVVDGYWCDVGNFDEYHRAIADTLYGKIRLSEPLGTHIGGGIWVGDDVDIAPSAQLFGPIYLGHGVKIKGDVTIHGPTVIRDYTIIDTYTRIERSVLWRNNYIGESCELRGAIITRQCSLKSKVIAFEGSVIADNCVIGEGAMLHPDIKIWPHKEIEAGATVKESVIWGAQGRRSLFGRHGVTGVVNIDLTPEFAAKLGTALGAILPRGSYVAMNRDAHRSSRMLKRALISGLPGTGVNVWDLGAIAVPVFRHFVRKHEDASAGIHVRLSPFDQRVVDIRMIDDVGLNQTKAQERAIERAFFREDFRRAFLDEIGVIQYAARAVENYTADFLENVNVERIRAAGFRIVIDYSHGLAGDTLANLLNRLGVEVVALNARLDETKLAILQDEFASNLDRVAKIVRVLNADAGIQLDVGGEKIFIVDEKGNPLGEMTTAALMTELALYANPGRPVILPHTLPNSFQTIADWHESPIIRTAGQGAGIVVAALRSDAILGVDGTGSFVFPQFQPAVDGMMATARLLEYLAVRELPVSKVVSYLPQSYMARDRAECPTPAKGMVMRRLNEKFATRLATKTEGVKVLLDEDEWIHLAPDPDLPHFLLIAEGQTQDRAGALVREYQALIRRLATQEAG